jgi:sugar phosphate isomerase/epimerase
VKFGIGSFAYRWAMGRPYYQPESPMSVDQLIDRCVHYGVKAVLLCNNVPLHEFTTGQLDSIKDRLIKEGLILETGSRGTNPDYFERMLEVSRYLGSKVLRIGWDMDRNTNKVEIEKQVQTAIDTFKALMPLAHKYDIQLAIENGKLNDIYEIEKIIQGVDDPYFGCTLDTCNSTCFTFPTNEVVDVLAPYAKSVHFKDYVVTLDPDGDVITGVPLGQGYVDFEYALDALRKNGYDGNIFLELYIKRMDNHEETCLYEEKCVKQSIEYARDELVLF